MHNLADLLALKRVLRLIHVVEYVKVHIECFVRSGAVGLFRVTDLRISHDINQVWCGLLSKINAVQEM